MAPLTKKTWIERFAIRHIGKTRGLAQARRDVRRLTSLVQFWGIFVATILIPSLLLSFLAISSISSDELRIDRYLRKQSNAILEQIETNLTEIFDHFEAQAGGRLIRGESPLNNLAQLSPYLRVAYRFNDSGFPVAPFTIPEPTSTPTPSVAYRRMINEGRHLEQQEQFLHAARSYRSAKQRTTDLSLTSEADFAQGRALVKANRPAQAERIFSNLYSQHGNLRTSEGFRIRDLILLKRAELLLESSPDEGTSALRALMDQLLSQHWELGMPGEPAITRRAIAYLSEHTRGDWLAQARTQLNERVDQLDWANRTVDELELLTGTAVQLEKGSVRYYARPDSPSLWATAQHDNLYVFGFSQQALLEEIHHQANQLRQFESDLKPILLGPNDEVPQHSIATQNLSPWLPFLTIAIVPTDIKVITQRKLKQRSLRALIVVTSVFLVIFGMLLSARIVSREVEMAHAKSEFAANVSHELRSPITQIRLKGEALQLGLIDDKGDALRHYDTIVREADRLSRLVDNVLDFSSIERGAKNYQFRPEDLEEVVWSTIQTLESTAASRNITISVTQPPSVPVIWIDRSAISQVLTNLISNAIKYSTGPGKIEVKITLKEKYIILSISDTGVGISIADQERIFDHFFRSKDPAIRREKGTGIGLSIVRYIVEAHGGTIDVKSRANKGSTFFVKLPLDPPTHPEKKPNA